MIHILYSKDRYLVLDKTKELVNKIIKEKSKVERLDFFATDNDFSFGHVVEAVNTVSLFQTPRVVFFYVEHEKDINKIDVDSLIELVVNPGTVDLILAFPKKLTQFKKLHAALRKHADEHVFTKSSDVNYSSKLNAGLKRYNVSMNEGAKRIFLDKMGEDQSRFDTELEKLALLEVYIDEDVVNRMITQGLETDIFSLGNALLDKNRDKAFEIYHSLLNQKNDPLNLAPLVASTLRTIYQVETLASRGYSSDGIQNMLKISKGQAWFVRNKQMGKVKNILPILNELCKLEQQAKLGEIDRFVAFELFMLNVMK
ncbi:MAG: DNA polymerase III subunit delta [Erysipelothrix sp.]|nr:DNA polymerase III subunit delta [Erysipelothrix sp.]